MYLVPISNFTTVLICQDQADFFLIHQTSSPTTQWHVCSACKNKMDSDFLFLIFFDRLTWVFRSSSSPKQSGMTEAYLSTENFATPQRWRQLNRAWKAWMQSLKLPLKSSHEQSCLLLVNHLHMLLLQWAVYYKRAVLKEAIYLRLHSRTVHYIYLKKANIYHQWLIAVQ